MGKMIIYQMLPRLWGARKERPLRGGSLKDNGSGKFSDIDSGTLAYLRDTLYVSHVWFTGVIRHATTEAFEGCPASIPAVVKGRAGSPYAIVDYYDVNPYLADNVENRMKEFELLLKRTHDAGLKVLIDFVPNHVSRDYGKVGMISPPGDHPAPFGAADDTSVHWSSGNDFFYYPGEPLTLPGRYGQYNEYPAKASGDCFSPSPEEGNWYETICLNYCDFHTPTWDKALDIVRYWCRKGVDGFRCDMVEMVPWQFMKWLIEKTKAEFPGTLFVAEVYNKDLYGHYIGTVGFDLLYDKSGLYDSLRQILEGHGSARGITWNWQSLGSLQPGMLNFLENHDEQRLASPFFRGDASRAGAALCVSALFNEASFMIYCGQEVGERGMDEEGFSGLDGRTTIFDWWSVASLHRLYEYIHTGTGLNDNEKDLLESYRKILSLAADPRIGSGRTYDLCYSCMGSAGFDPDRHFAFLRGGGGTASLFVCNFSSRDVAIRVVIPPEAFAFMGINKAGTSVLDVPVKADGWNMLPV